MGSNLAILAAYQHPPGLSSPTPHQGRAATGPILQIRLPRPNERAPFNLSLSSSSWGGQEPELGGAGHGACLVSTTEGSAQRMPSGNTGGPRGAMQLMATLGLPTPQAGPVDGGGFGI